MFLIYSTCLFCTKDLGTNDVLETLPIGRRIAFDAAEGRLWVVCRHCAKWNLVPFDSRLETIDACERLFRSTTMRYSTDNIGLARVKEGLELVRIGEAQRPEFAGWRYGDSFGRRRRRNLLIAGGVAAAGIAVVSGGLAMGVSFGMLGQLPNYYNLFVVNRRVTVRVPRADGPPIELSDMLASKARLVRRPNNEWLIRTKVMEESSMSRKLRKAGSQEIEFTGPEAEQLLAGVLVRLNHWGGTQRTIRDAVELVERQGDSAGVIAGPFSPVMDGSGSQLLAKTPSEWRLAAEIALNESSERLALAGELRLLEWQWKEADRLAKISDSLAVPESVDEELARRKEG
ncbi:MAG: hypothetical protein IPO52_07790 [Gemmatimonadetes bacterium]|nr:hypothetical protein [Gemmatimonadota bacterium]